jgi:hypothetical protein
MKIEEAKKALEEKVIFLDGVIGVGTIKNDDRDTIEIAIEKGKPGLKSKIEGLIKDLDWLSHPVTINETEQFLKH